MMFHNSGTSLVFQEHCWTQNFNLYPYKDVGM